MLDCVIKLFPHFGQLAPDFELEHILPGATSAELAALESQLGIPLPSSYKRLLRCARGFWLLGGVVQFGSQHPFVHDFEPYENLTPRQQQRVQLKGGEWPPPSHGMLCFAEFFMEADGDQVLFDISRPQENGEYPIMYYAHEQRPPSVRELASGFSQFMETFLDYPAFRREC